MWEYFVEAVDRHLGFLVTEYRFVKKSAKLPFVIFESDKVRVGVYYAAHRFNELDLSISKVCEEERNAFLVGIDMLMRLKDGPKSEGYMSSHPSTAEALEAEVRRMAELLKKYGSNLLKGDLSDIARLEQLEAEALRLVGPKSK